MLGHLKHRPFFCDTEVGTCHEVHRTEILSLGLQLKINLVRTVLPDLKDKDCLNIQLKYFLVLSQCFCFSKIVNVLSIKFLFVMLLLVFLLFQHRKM